MRAAAAPAAIHPPSSVADLIATRIEEDVVLGRRHPRERLIEQDLSEQFKTHRGDVRLALFELEKRGIIQRIPNRGAIVRDLTPAEVQQIYDVREQLEVMAVRVLPLPVAGEHLRKLEQLQRQHSEAVEAGDLLTVFYSNLHFHQALFALCGNACLIDTINHLAHKVHIVRSSANADSRLLDRARREHSQMLEALRRSRRKDLVRLTRQHLKAAPLAYARAYHLRFGNPDARTKALASRR